jgi:hypothetical protein
VSNFRVAHLLQLRWFLTQLIHHNVNQRFLRGHQMKTSFTAALYAVLIGGSPSAYGDLPKGKEAGLARTSYRRNPAAEIQQFGEAWGLPVHQVIAVLVFLRSWLHNHLVLRNQPASALAAGDAEVLFAYARWLDGFPQVVRALPERVLLEEASIVRLKVPKFLPVALAPLVAEASAENPNRPSTSVVACASAPLRRSVAPSIKEPVRANDRRFGFVKSPAPDLGLGPRIGRSGAKAPGAGFSDRR